MSSTYTVHASIKDHVKQNLRAINFPTCDACFTHSKAQALQLGTVRIAAPSTDSEMAAEE